MRKYKRVNIYIYYYVLDNTIINRYIPKKRSTIMYYYIIWNHRIIILCIEIFTLIEFYNRETSSTLYIPHYYPH